MFFPEETGNRRQATGNRQCQKMPDPMNRHGAMTEFRSGLISADIFSSDGLDGQLASQPESMQTIAFLTIARRLLPVACCLFDFLIPDLKSTNIGAQPIEMIALFAE